jgi:hypothetical protein
MPTPDPVKLFVAILHPDSTRLELGIAALVQAFGPVDLMGTSIPFDHTDYYTEEMGAGLSRTIVGLERLQAPEFIVEAKHQARDLEGLLAAERRRRVNLDIGYLDAFKVTLASFKGRGNKVYLGRDVWLDTQLYFERGALHPLPWTFPDFRAGRYTADLLRLRTRYRDQLKARLFDAGGQTATPE